MTEPAAPFQLAQLDGERPAALDPAVWSANRAALERESPELAAQLGQVSLPETWRPALALDDFVAYRVDEPGQPAMWLGGSAAPRTRAAGLLKSFEPTGQNLALPGCGTGAELQRLLEQLPAHIAIFIFEADLRVLAAVLRAHDFAAVIEQGRCVFLSPDSAAAALAAILEQHTGLLPPGTIILTELVAPTRVDEVRGICETVGRAANQQRQEHLHALQAALADVAPPPASAPRLAVTALRPHRVHEALARHLVEAAHELEWPTLCGTTSNPRQVHPLLHAAALAEFKPSLTVSVNQLPETLPLRPAGTRCAWLLDEHAVPTQLPRDDTLYLAASPRVAAALRRGGAADEAVLDWYWACRSDLPEPPDGPPDQTVILAADLPADQPEAYDITHSTHVKLWEALRTAAAQSWEKQALDAERFLVRTERTCGVELADPPLRESFLKVIDRALIPGVILEHIVRALTREPVTVLTVGGGWQRITEKNLTSLGENVFELPDQGRGLHPLACVFAARQDVLSPALLHAAAAGWPMLIHCPGGRVPTAELGEVLRPGQHFEPFADLTELLRALESLRSAPQAAQRRCERARHHVRENHSYRRRLQDLLAFVRSALPGSDS